MTDNYETKSVRDLRDFVTGADKQRERDAVAHLLSLNGTKMPKQAETDNPLVNEVLKQVKR